MDILGLTGLGLGLGRRRYRSRPLPIPTLEAFVGDNTQNKTKEYHKLMKHPMSDHDGILQWVELTTSPNHDVVTFTASDIKYYESLGYRTRTLTPDSIARCAAVPLKIVDTTPEQLFGKDSNPALAQKIRNQYPLAYYSIREKAVAAGLVAAQPIQENQRISTCYTEHSASSLLESPSEMHCTMGGGLPPFS